ncbi:MAG: CPBP family intramembrane metalloprotease [Deltaproteobacteria bacterium]|nr:CPBP family intramembrane metalloprotease [Deltaproteobacteria bacterium]
MGADSSTGRLRRWLTWQRVAIDQIEVRRPGREAALFTAHACFFFVLAIAIGLIIRDHPWPLLGAAKFTDDFWYIVVFKVGGLLVLPLALFFGMGYRPGDLAPGWQPSARAALSIAIAFLVGNAINLQHLSRIGNALRGEPRAGLWLALAAAAIVPLVAAAIPEEIAFRAILQTRLEKTCNRPVAIGASVLLFTLWHLPTRYLLAHGVEGQAGDLGSVLLGTAVPVAIVGLVFSALWDRYRNLPLLIGLHYGIDLLPSVSSFLMIEF